MTHPPTLRCPTCGADQPWQPECRRCKSDLRLLIAALAERQRLRHRCLWQLARGQYRQATATASQLAQRFADPTACRLLAVSLLADGQCQRAAQLAGQSPTG